MVKWNAQTFRNVGISQEKASVGRWGGGGGEKKKYLKRDWVCDQNFTCEQVLMWSGVKEEIGERSERQGRVAKKHLKIKGTRKYMQWINLSIQWITRLVFLMDSAIQRFNNRGLG